MPLAAPAAPAPSTAIRSATHTCTGALLTLMVAQLLGASAAFAAPGEIDVHYGIDGVAFINGAGDGEDTASALLPLADGSVLAAGSLDSGLPTSGDFALVKLGSNGVLDPSFGDGGIALLHTGGDAEAAYALLRQPDGRIVVAGALEADSYLDFGVARFLPDGSLDTSFGGDDGNGARTGYTLLNTGADEFVHDEALGVARQADGKLVLAGQTTVFESGFHWARFALARVHADGMPDTGFGSEATGVVIAPATEADEILTGLALRADGTLPPDDRITVVGYVFVGGQALVRRYLANGTPDASFDGDGTLVIAHRDAADVVTGLETIAAAVLQDDGKLLVTGTSAERGFTAMRFNVDGSRDAGFGDNGRRTVKFSEEGSYDEPAALTVQADGRIVLAGYVTSDSPRMDADFGVARLLADGSLDTEFGDGGRVTYPLSQMEDAARAVAVVTGGGIVAAGFGYQHALGLTDMAFLRLHGDSRLFKDGFEAD